MGTRAIGRVVLMKILRTGACLLLLLAGLLAASLNSMPANAAVAHPHSPTYYAWHFAQSQSGKPYVWGGTGPGGFDCSGLAYASFRYARITLPRTTYGMLGSRHLIRTYHPTTGDLAFYGSGHVELYVRPGWTYGAQEPGTRVGYHNWSASWHPTAFYMIR
jgi:cell wall-associated NlpC family hydrolase